MADDRTPPPADDEAPEPPVPPTPEEAAEEAPEPVAEAPEPVAEAPEPVAEAPEPVAAGAPEAAAPEAEGEGPEIVDDEVVVVASDDVPGAEAVVDAQEAAPGVLEAEEADEVEGDVVERVRPEIPGADLELDLVGEGEDPLFGQEGYAEGEELEGEERRPEDSDQVDDQPIAQVTIDLGAGARYRATGKRKTAVARVTLRPGTGAYTVNGRTLEDVFPRNPLQRTIRQPLETVGYEGRMDVVARMHGGGVSAQAGALRHGISRALLEADPNLRGELKRRGFLTRDPRVKERKKAGLKKARKRPQFSKR
jgi:small subunit ribosomal protein S9